MSDSSLALTLVRAGLSLVLVLGLLVLCLRVLARRGGFAGPTRPAVEVEVVGRRQLSRTASVQVVRVGEDVLVLGVTDSQISTLHHLSAEDLGADEGEEATTLPVATTPSPLVETLRRQADLGRLVTDSVSRRGRGGRHRGGPGLRSGASRRRAALAVTDRSEDLPARLTTEADTGAGRGSDHPARHDADDRHEARHDGLGHDDQGGGRG